MPRGRCFSALAFTASCVVFFFSLYRDWTLQIGDAKLDAEATQIRQQLHELKQAMSHGHNSPCINKWDIKYPDEIDDWRGHSCTWKKRWGQCDDFTRQCARTCGSCDPSLAFPHPAAANDSLSTHVLTVASENQRERRGHTRRARR